MREPLRITRNGQAAWVLTDAHGSEGRGNTLALLEILALGQREIARGEFQDAGPASAELDQLDAQGPPGVSWKSGCRSPAKCRTSHRSRPMFDV